MQQALAAIQQNLTAYINKVKATTGAAEVGVSTISGISAGNVQKALEGLRSIQITLDSNIKKLMSTNGAAAVGVNKISGMQSQNVQKALEELRKAIDDSVSGIIPGGSITADMLSDDVVKELQDKINRIPIKIDVSTDVHTLEPGRVYTVEGAVSIDQNHPLNASFAHLTYFVIGQTNNAYGYEVLFCIGSDNTVWLKTRSWNVWNPWKKIMTDTKPKKIDLELKSGWIKQSNGLATYFKTQEKIVYVLLNIISNKAVSPGDIIAELPLAFRPDKALKIPVICKVNEENSLVMGHLDITLNGEIKIYDAVTGSETINEMSTPPIVFLAAD